MIIKFYYKNYSLENNIRINRYVLYCVVKLLKYT